MDTTTARTRKQPKSTGAHVRVLSRLRGLWAKRSLEPLTELKRIRKEWK